MPQCLCSLQKGNDTGSSSLLRLQHIQLLHQVSPAYGSKRKSRCDVGLPRCGPCQRSNEECDYFDTAKGEKVSRTYVVHLQNKVQNLERQLALLENQHHYYPDAEMMVRGAGLVRFKENDESRYLGPSSGIAITRLVMELAKQNTNSTTIKQIIPAVKAQKLKDRSTLESSKPTSKVYPKYSCDAAEDLPSPELTENLIDRFNQTGAIFIHNLESNMADKTQLSTCCLRCMSPLFEELLITFIKDRSTRTKTSFSGW